MVYLSWKTHSLWKKEIFMIFYLFIYLCYIQLWCSPLTEGKREGVFLISFCRKRRNHPGTYSTELKPLDRFVTSIPLIFPEKLRWLQKLHHSVSSTVFHRRVWPLNVNSFENITAAHNCGKRDTSHQHAEPGQGLASQHVAASSHLIELDRADSESILLVLQLYT